LDETLTDTGGAVSQADLTDGRTSDKRGDRTTIFDSYQKTGDVAVHHRRYRRPLPPAWWPMAFMRNGTPDWPRPFHSITNVALMTFILLTSSLTMLIGLRAARKGDKGRRFPLDHDYRRRRHFFAFLHIREWFGLIDEGMTCSRIRGARPLFSSLFFSITGLHLAARNRRRHRADRSRIALPGRPLQSR
jgi:hypothetical protein